MSRAYPEQAALPQTRRSLHMVEMPPQRAFSFPARRRAWTLRPEPRQLELKLDGRDAARAASQDRATRDTAGSTSASPAFTYPQLRAVLDEEDRAAMVERARQSAHLNSLRGYKAQRAYLIERAAAGDPALFYCGRNYSRIPEALVTRLSVAALYRGSEREQRIREALPRCEFCRLPAFVKPEGGGVFHCLFERCPDRDLHEIARSVVAGEVRLA